jgi:hypothetical protein
MNFYSLITALFILNEIVESIKIDAKYQRINKGKALTNAFMLKEIIQMKKNNANSCRSLCTLDLGCVLTYYNNNTKMCSLFDESPIDPTDFTTGNFEVDIVHKKICKIIILKCFFFDNS